MEPYSAQRDILSSRKDRENLASGRSIVDVGKISRPGIPRAMLKLECPS